jgi:allophanate hydrolase subunit 1
MFRMDGGSLSLLSLGDRVRFLPIDAQRFAELERACA